MLTKVKVGKLRCVEILCTENNKGVWGQSPQPPEANGSSGAEPLTLRRFYSCFFFKKYAFLGVVWYKFRIFKWLNKVLLRPQGALAPLAMPLGAKARIVYLLSLLYYSILNLNQINVLT